jgi:hypothetical protein
VNDVTSDGLRADLDVLEAAPLLTGRYQNWRPEHGVAVRSTVGTPKFWRHGELIHARAITPYGVFGSGLDVDAARSAYVARLEARAQSVVAFLAAVARQHPGQPVVVLCFDNVHAGESCHRRWFAGWFEDRFGIAVPELR